MRAEQKERVEKSLDKLRVNTGLDEKYEGKLNKCFNKKKQIRIQMYNETKRLA